MSDELPPKPTVVVRMGKCLGSTPSDDGTTIKLGFVVNDDQPIDLIAPTDRAVDLMALIGSALGQVKRVRSNDLNARYVYPVATWELCPQSDNNLLTLVLRMTDGAEVCFQLDRREGLHMLESLSVILGAQQIVTPPNGQKH